jgi:hypothetical protein
LSVFTKNKSCPIDIPIEAVSLGLVCGDVRFSCASDGASSLDSAGESDPASLKAETKSVATVATVAASESFTTSASIASACALSGAYKKGIAASMQLVKAPNSSCLQDTYEALE